MSHQSNNEDVLTNRIQSVMGNFANIGKQDDSDMSNQPEAYMASMVQTICDGVMDSIKPMVMAAPEAPDFDVNKQDQLKNGRTALHIAAARNDVEFIRELFHVNANMNASDEKGFTPLFYAVAAGHLDAVEVLVECGAVIETAVTDTTNGRNEVAFVRKKRMDPVLFYTLRLESTDMMKLLIELGADVNIQNTYGYTALMMAAGLNKTNAMEILLDHGAKLDIRNKAGYTALYAACEKGHKEAVAMLLNRGCNWVCHSLDRTAMTVASMNGHTDLVEYLLDWGFDVSHEDDLGDTALNKAAIKGDTKTIKLLVQHGADIEHYDKEGLSPLSITASQGHLAATEMLLDLGAIIEPENWDFSDTSPDKSKPQTRRDQNKIHFNHILTQFTNIKYTVDDELKNLLSTDFLNNILTTILQPSIRWVSSTMKWSPLILACITGHTAIVELLLARGADVNKRYPPKEYSALVTAIFSHRCKVVALLLDRGAVLSDCDRARVALYPRIGESVEMIQLLIRHGLVTYNVSLIACSPEIQQCFPAQISIVFTYYYTVLHLNRDRQDLLPSLYDDLAEEVSIMSHPVFLIDLSFLWAIECIRLYNVLQSDIGDVSHLGEGLPKIELSKYFTAQTDRNFHELSVTNGRHIFVTVTYGKYNTEKTKWTTYASVTVAVKEELLVGSLMKSIKEFLFCYNADQVNRAGSDCNERFHFFKRKKVEQELLVLWTSDERELDPTATVGESALVYNPVIRVFSGLDKRFAWLGRWQDDFFNGKIKQLMYEEMSIIKPMMKDDPLLCMLLRETPSVSHARKLIHEYFPRAHAILLFDKRDILADDEMMSKAANGDLFYGIIWRFEDLEIMNILGRGSFGSVYRCRTKGRTNQFALKEIRKHSRKPNNDFIAEIITLAVIGCHPFVVPYSHLYEDEKNLFIRMPLMQKSVTEYIKQRKKTMMKIDGNGSGALGENEIFIYSEQILSGLYFLHKNGIVHMDLSGGNILMESEYKVKLSDFGLAKYASVSEKNECGRSRYASPETLAEEACDFKSDIWSFGAVIIEMLTGELPHGSVTSAKAIRITRTKKTIDFQPRYEISQELLSFIAWCIKSDPKDRPSSVKLMTHNFFCRENSS